MTSVKVECDCGQRYAFDVEPVHGRMPSPVACPTCGADGTAKANAILAKSFAASPVPVLIAPAPIRIATAAAPVLVAPAAVPVAAASAPFQSAPVLSVARPAVAVSMVPPPPSGAMPPPIPRMPPALAARAVVPKSSQGKDGWNAPETGIHKVGQYIVAGPTIIAAMIAGGVFGFELDPMILGAVVAVMGIVGGILNIIGRGPIWAGALVGLVTAVGGFGLTWWWIQQREGARKIYKIELVVAFAIGCVPGIGLQYLLQKLLRPKAATA